MVFSGANAQGLQADIVITDRSTTHRGKKDNVRSSQSQTARQRDVSASPSRIGVVAVSVHGIYARCAATLTPLNKLAPV
jgi:hypothetical protein